MEVGRDQGGRVSALCPTRAVQQSTSSAVGLRNQPRSPADGDDGQPDAEGVEKTPASGGCTRLAQGSSIITHIASSSGFDCRPAVPGRHAETLLSQKGRGLTAETHKENYNGKWFHGSNFLGSAVIRY